MHRDLQFGMRENPASDRRHGSRLAASTQSGSRFIGENNAQAITNIAVASPLLDQALSSAHAAQPQAATAGKTRDEYGLLTIRDVAQLLQVPVSWVYEHTRKRSVDRIPGFRLGKYWRFNEEDVRAWLHAKTQK
jgi:excisionase family DNA binding protein